MQNNNSSSSPNGISVGDEDDVIETGFAGQLSHLSCLAIASSYGVVSLVSCLLSGLCFTGLLNAPEISRTKAYNRFLAHTMLANIVMLLSLYIVGPFFAFVGGEQTQVSKRLTTHRKFFIRYLCSLISQVHQ